MPKKGFTAHTIYLPEAWEGITPKDITSLVTNLTGILTAINEGTVAELFKYHPELQVILDKVAGAKA